MWSGHRDLEDIHYQRLKKWYRSWHIHHLTTKVTVYDFLMEDSPRESAGARSQSEHCTVDFIDYHWFLLLYATPPVLPAASSKPLSKSDYGSHLVRLSLIFHPIVLTLYLVLFFEHSLIARNRSLNQEISRIGQRPLFPFHRHWSSLLTKRNPASEVVLAVFRMLHDSHLLLIF